MSLGKELKAELNIDLGPLCIASSVKRDKGKGAN